jgi:hypothetical protein
MMPLEQRKAALKKWVAYVKTLSTEEAYELVKPISDYVKMRRRETTLYKKRRPIKLSNLRRKK